MWLQLLKKRKRGDKVEELLNRCPKCGGILEYSELMQYSNIYKIKRNGELSKRRVRKEDNDPMEYGYIYCSNCDFTTDAESNYKGRDEKITIRQREEKYYFKKYLYKYKKLLTIYLYKYII